MATGSIAEALTVNPWAGSRNTNRSAQGFVLGLPPQQDVGYVTSDTYVTIHLWNGTANDAVLTSITGDEGAEGITWDASPPLPLLAMQSAKVVIDVGIDGPLSFTGLLSFVSSCNTLTLTLTGTRAPHLEGDVGYLLFSHNWEDGLDEVLAWKTDVLTAFDRTEQRIQLRTLPRRSWNVRFVVSGAARRKLETWLGMRKSRYLFMPIWRDMVRLEAPIATGDTAIAIAESCDNYVDGTPIAVWSGLDTVEIRTLTGHGSDYLAVDSPFSRDWPAGVMLAPARYCLSLETRKVNRFTEEVGDYRLTVMANDDGWEPSGAEPETYRDLPVCPFVPGWNGGEEGYDNKWVSLDNDTGRIEFDVQSEEPVMSRDARFLLIGRDRINTFLAFLKDCAGRLTPFWLAANDRGLELSATGGAGETFIVIESINYEYALKDSPARAHVELITTEGDVVRRGITGVETLPSGEEKLTLDAALPMDLSAAVLNRCAWLELVRLDSDEITLHWVSGDCLEVTVPIVVLP